MKQNIDYTALADTICTELNARYDHSAWDKAVTLYALDLLEDVQEGADNTPAAYCKIIFPEGEAQKASRAFTRTRTGDKKRQEPQKTAPVAFLFAVSFYGSITLKVFSNLEAYASRRFRTVASPLICTCPAC